jgi:hypothetical protein
MRFPGFRDRTPTTTTTGLTPGVGAAAVPDNSYANINQAAATREAVHDARDARRDADRYAIEAEKRAKAEYQRGLRDGVRAKRNNPILTILVLLLALLGIAIGVLAIREGSFAGAGQVLDRSAGVAAVEARDTGGELAQDAGQTLQSAGAAAERDAEAARR